MESREGINNLLLVSLIPRTLVLLGVHTVGEGERRVEIQIAKQGKVTTDGYCVLHTIAPIFGQTGVQNLIFLGRNRIAQLSGIAH